MHTLVTIEVSGRDAAEFLQGQLTNDLERLASESEMLAAWCNPKGRVIWFGTVSTRQNGFGLLAPAATAADVVSRLTVFRFRSRVEFSIADEGAAQDPASLIRQGHPYIDVAQVEKYTPHMLNLDLLDAVSFDKGCYTGQEIVARTHYKGATKRRTLRFDSETPVSAGDRVSDGRRDIGDVLNVAGNELLAVLPVNQADEALAVNGNRLTRRPLPYSTDAAVGSH